MARLNKIFALFFIIFSLNCSPRKPAIPDRPFGVPVEARWYGGKDGGCWIKIDETGNVNQFYVECYFDGDGEIWEKGIFELDTLCTKRKFTITHIKESIQGYYGDSILILKDVIQNNRHCTLRLIPNNNL